METLEQATAETLIKEEDNDDDDDNDEHLRSMKYVYCQPSNDALFSYTSCKEHTKHYFQTAAKPHWYLTTDIRLNMCKIFSNVIKIFEISVSGEYLLKIM